MPDARRAVATVPDDIFEALMLVSPAPLPEIELDIVTTAVFDMDMALTPLA